MRSNKQHVDWERKKTNSYRIMFYLPVCYYSMDWFEGKTIGTPNFSGENHGKTSQDVPFNQSSDQETTSLHLSFRTSAWRTGSRRPREMDDSYG